MKMDNDNAKDPDWKIPVQLPGVKPEKYQPEIDANRDSLHKQKHDKPKQK